MDDNNIKHFVTDDGYAEHAPLWKQVRQTIKGKPGAIKLIQDDGYFGLVPPAYTKRNNNHNIVDERRRQYFARGRFFNAVGRTHDAYVGMIGSKDTEVELPDALDGFKTSVDGEGSTMNSFALHIAGEVLKTARHGLLVDLPDIEGLTRAQAADKQPRIVDYAAEDIGRAVYLKGELVEVPLKERYWKQDGDNWDYCEQVRVLCLEDGAYTSRVYRDGVLDEYVQPRANGSTIPFIPFLFVGAENNKPSYDRPVMFDLAHQNLGHFQHDCDNRENLHYHGQGMTNVFSNMDAEEASEKNPRGIDVGAKGVNQFDQDDRVEILQIAATGALGVAMESDEKRMIYLGAQVTQDQSSTQTLGAKRIESNASTSQLKRISINVSEALTKCCKWVAEFVKANPDDVVVELNSQFITDDMTYQDVLAVFQLYQSGAASIEEVHEAKRLAGMTTKSDEELEEGLTDDLVPGQNEAMAQMQLTIEQMRAQIQQLTGQAVDNGTE